MNKRQYSPDKVNAGTLPPQAIRKEVWLRLSNARVSRNPAAQYTAILQAMSKSVILLAHILLSRDVRWNGGIR
ncbi:hypothetical protein [Achromobacter sp.]|uniref:hypothetical protein n=1 Tax=Achromobacter sp. TaxID=134375 RepID=UPI002F955C7B